MEDVNDAPEEIQDIQHTEATNCSNSAAESEAPLMDLPPPTKRFHEIKQTKKAQNFMKKHKIKLLALIVLLIIIGVAVTVSMIFPHSAKPRAAPLSKTTTKSKITSTTISKTMAATSKATTDVQSKTTSAPQSTPPVIAFRSMSTAAVQIVVGCDLVQPPERLKVNCSNGQNIGSLCSFSCDSGWHLQGSFSITCQSSMKWSAPPPVCLDECPPCYTGKYCTHSTSWKVLKIYISNTPFAKFEAIYAGFEISCRSSLHNLNILRWRYDCQCTDKTSGVMTKCGKNRSSRNACQNALAKLVRTMVKLKQYPATCDLSDMPTEC